MEIHEIWKKMAQQRDCMFVDHDGPRLRARPMAPVVQQAERAIWFVTDRRGAKDDEIAREPHVCLTFVDHSDRFHLSVSGRAEVVRDTAKLKEIWTSYMEAFFPGGPDDPNAILVKVEPDQAEYWDGDGDIVSAFKLAAGILGERTPNLGDNQKVQL
ncbi:pyridoxamine 5'-phosphate oxidase family protein [Xanthobacter dioxanivorans]|uniref:Pyridoxamine 5'-phosphate oxidase family protein n=1 Tax=Xanthobacter dioxanivorans TaxID=2528964 RepID=A0A974SIT0_9HYPH|nr:pyridoxamine 5'-phosphate oxidase family protein [Xanthobacter dioxanivorans]QRG06504.1 pyridoxamine 5'-phosphate oxidase family protein [Xanthobacter dioxanivorans]